MGGVYPTACLINHSCIPNSHNSWNSDAGHETIHAILQIKSGEEVTILYDRGGPSTVRQVVLKEAFGFNCKCSGCSLPPAELQASDARRLLIQSLNEAIGDPFSMTISPKESLRSCQELLHALEEEYSGGAEALNARLFYDAFQISVAHGDQARASIFAERAYKARVICEGEDSPGTLRAKSLALKPANHSSFSAFSTEWETTREMVPKSMDTTQFNKWLFREES